MPGRRKRFRMSMVLRLPRERHAAHCRVVESTSRKQHPLPNQKKPKQNCEPKNGSRWRSWLPAEHDHLGLSVVFKEDDILSVETPADADTLNQVEQASFAELTFACEVADERSIRETISFHKCPLQPFGNKSPVVGNKNIVPRDIERNGLGRLMALRPRRIRKDDLPSKALLESYSTLRNSRGPAPLASSAGCGQHRSCRQEASHWIQCSNEPGAPRPVPAASEKTQPLKGPIRGLHEHRRPGSADNEPCPARCSRAIRHRPASTSRENPRRRQRHTSPQRCILRRS